MSPLSRHSLFLTAVVILAAAGTTVVRTLADLSLRAAHDSTSASRACALTSGNPDCWRAAARLREQEALESLPLWRRSLELDPSHAEALIAAAASLESTGKPDQVEKLLLKAAEWNALWPPRWALSSFYLRHGRLDEFWHWTRLAFERSHRNRDVLFRQCRQAGGTAAFLLKAVIPAEAGPRLDFVRFLNGAGAVDELPAAADSLIQAGGGTPATVVPALVASIGTLAGALRPRQAFAIWAGMCRGGLLPYPPPDESNPVTNPNLSTPFLETAFDWQTSSGPDVNSLPVTGGHGIRITLTGAQPAGAVLLKQWLFLRGARRWILRFSARTTGLDDAGSGPVWRLLDSVTGLPYSSGHRPFASADWGEFEFPLDGPPGDRLVLLALADSRGRGGLGMQGDIWLRRVALEMAGGVAP